MLVFSFSSFDIHPLVNFSQTYLNMFLCDVTGIVANASKLNTSIAQVFQNQHAQKMRRKSLFNLFFCLLSSFCMTGPTAAG